MCNKVITSPKTGQRDVSRAEHVGVAVACRPLSVRLTSAADLGTTEVPWQSSSSRQSSCIVEASTLDLRNDEPDGVRLKWPEPADNSCGTGEGLALGGGGGCWSRTTADCWARLPPAMLVCNKSRLKSYRAADRSSPRGRYRSDWRSGDRRTTAAACGCVRSCVACTVVAMACAATGCWPSNRFFDSWMAAYRSMADRPDAGRTYGCCTAGVRCPSPGGDWIAGVRCCCWSVVCGRPVGLARQSRIGDMLLLLMSIRPALRSFFTGVDAETFRSRPLLSPLTDVDASGVPRLVSKTCTRKIGCYTRCESLRFRLNRYLISIVYLCTYMVEGCWKA